MTDYSPYKSIADWLIESAIIIVVGTVILIVAGGIKDSSTPMAPYYMSGAVIFSLNFGIMIERIRTKKKNAQTQR